MSEPRNLAHKLIAEHLVEGELRPGTPIALRIDQCLTQDATGTLVMLELEAMGIDRISAPLACQYVDHNLVQSDARNPDDHLFLQAACARYGIQFSPAGNGVSHPVHTESFAVPGATLLGSDSHTCANGGMGMLAIGAGGLEVALALIGEPFHLRMPEVVGIRLEGELPPFVSAKDVILEVLRRYDVDGGAGKIFEYHGPGLASLSAMDRHVIANMGTEAGATTTVFPSDERTREHLARHDRADDWQELAADDGASYDAEDTIDLSTLEPLIAKPSSPGNVVPVREVAGEPIYQAYIGSSANPGFRDFAVVASMVAGRRVRPGVSFDINPSTRRILAELTESGLLGDLVLAGARLHQVGCNGCIGMGQAPASGRNSLRTVPRNFPGRSGTREDAVFLCSPETAAASALAGVITDPRDADLDPPEIPEPPAVANGARMIVEPPARDEAADIEIPKGPNIVSFPDLDAVPDELSVTVLLRVGDDISTDEILPAGSRVLPYRSNLPALAEFCFELEAPDYAERAAEHEGGHAIVAGSNYGQGSSREHAALAPRSIGLRLVIADSFARIHRQNLINFGVLPLRFTEKDDRERIDRDATIEITGLHQALTDGEEVRARVDGDEIALRHDLSEREAEILLAGGVVNHRRDRSNGDSSGRRSS